MGGREFESAVVAEIYKSGILDKPVLHGLVLSNDDRIKRLDQGISALPVGWFLG